MAEKVNPAIEAALTSHRLQELAVEPVQGKFDAAHLKEIHRRIFQDLPSHLPGQQRTQNFDKHRALDSGRRYIVPYADAAKISSGLVDALAPFKNLDSLKDLTAKEFSGRITKLYADLDYLHPFTEGNSRTLRAFTAQLSNEAGFKLDWAQTAATPQAHDALYVARDKEIFDRLYPGLNEQRADVTQDKAEYEAYMHFVRHYSAATPLKTIIDDSLRKQFDLDAAAAFKGEGADKALQRFPHLAGAYAALEAVSRELSQSGLDERGQRVVIDTARLNVISAIERGNTPTTNIRQQAADLPKSAEVERADQIRQQRQRGLDR